MASNTVEVEPILQEAIVLNNMPAFQADLKVDGILEVERVVVFDNRIINADAPSNVNQDFLFIKNPATQKHNKYDKAAEHLRAIPPPWANNKFSLRDFLQIIWNVSKRTAETLSAK